jgi:hypothetical protein
MIPNNSANVFQKLEKFKQIRKRQVFCPVARHRVLVSPLTVADDLSLRTMITSPDIYDNELSHLIFDHCEFPDLQTRPKYEQFIDNVSHFDKKILIWGIFDATYDTLGEQELTCPDAKCAEKFKQVIKARELITEDSIKNIWDKEEAFTTHFVEHTLNVSEEDLDRIIFKLTIPTMKKHLDILRMIDAAMLKDNMSKFGTLMSRTEELALITKSINIYFDKNPESQPSELKTAREIHRMIGDYIPLDEIANIIKSFNDEYSKMDPEFKAMIQCPTCGKEFPFKIDMEVALFRSFLGVTP